MKYISLIWSLNRKGEGGEGRWGSESGEGGISISEFNITITVRTPTSPLPPPPVHTHIRYYLAAFVSDSPVQTEAPRILVASFWAKFTSEIGKQCDF